MGFSDATTVYACSRGTKYTRLRLHHEGFYAFSRHVSRMRRLCEEGGALQDVIVDRFLRTVERFRYYVSAAPISFARCPLNTPEVMGALGEDARRLEIGWPSLGEESREILLGLRDLIDEDAAPYLECAACLKCKPIVEREAMVVGPTNLLLAARATVDELIGPDALPLLAPAELKHGTTFDRLLLAGPLAWFTRHAAYVLSAPRAPQMVSISYDWLPDYWAPQMVFLHSEACATDVPAAPKSVNCRLIPVSDALEVLDDGVLPSSEALFTGDFGVAPQPRQASGSADEAVPTRGFLIEPASVLLVEESPENRMLVIDFSREAGAQIVKVPVSEIEPGMFVLHRSAGGGDYVVDLANRILGTRCSFLRSRQSLWKDKLRALAKRDGYEQVARNLTRCGSGIASYQNVRNWVSARNIMTNAPADFEAIMKLVGLEDESAKLWTDMKSLRRAHLMAGAQIKKMLLKQVAKADSAELLRLGYGDFDLGTDDGGALSAHRVLEIVEHTPEYPSDALPLFREI